MAMFPESDQKYKDDHIFVYVSENFNKQLREVCGFEFVTGPVEEEALEYISGKNTPSETYGVLSDTKLLRNPSVLSHR